MRSQLLAKSSTDNFNRVTVGKILACNLRQNQISLESGSLNALIERVRFAEKTVSDQEVSVYKLDFKAMVKALHIGLLIREINSYCAAFSSVPLPDNVQAAFAEWEAQSGRIRIRTVTVVEADDLFLLEEIKNYKGMQALSEGGLSTVLVLTPGAEKKAKAVIEKNNRFCVWGS